MKNYDFYETISKTTRGYRHLFAVFAALTDRRPTFSVLDTRLRPIFISSCESRGSSRYYQLLVSPNYFDIATSDSEAPSSAEPAIDNPVTTYESTVEQYALLGGYSCALYNVNIVRAVISESEAV